MSVTAKNRGISGTGYLSDDNRTDEGLLIVHGVALGDNDVTLGAKSGERKLWRPEVLEESAHLLDGKDIVVNHENQDAYEKVGEVTDAQYDSGRGVIYQGVVKDDELEEKIELGWLDVSPKLLHSNEFDEIEGIKAPQSIHDFPNLSIVRKGASPSNELEAGQHPELSAEELQASFEEDEGVQEYHYRSEEEELQETPEDYDFSRWMFEDKQGAQGAAQAFPCGGIHKHTVQGEEWYMPCGSHDDFLKALKNMKGDEMAKFSEDDFVTWDTSNGPAYGKIVDWTDDGTYDASIDGDVSVSADEDDPAALIQIYDDSGGTWSPTDTMVGHKFSTLNEWNPENVSEENSASEELQLSQASMPDYSGTETSSWADVSKTLDNFLSGVSGDVSDVETVNDLTQEQKNELASHSLLGDPEGETFDEILFFPVVNPDNNNLNRGALEAVRGGRGQSADISQSAMSSSFRMAGELLNEEFDADVEEEMVASSVHNAVEVVELEVDQEELDEVYSDWSDAVNMTASELRRWSGNSCSREASMEPEEVIERNLNLLETPKPEWETDEIQDANKTISFINRMNVEENEPEEPRDGSFGCPSNWAISLLNWAYNPFDSLPEEPDNDDLESVEELSGEEMSNNEEMSQEERRMASMLSSYSALTKDESMGIIRSINPNKMNDIQSMSKMIGYSLGAHEEEMQKLMEKMAQHEKDSMSRGDTKEVVESYLSDQDSPLNKVMQ
jgi:hypothetical protein